jgi:uncharacterized protein (TIGR02284 family)
MKSSLIPVHRKDIHQGKTIDLLNILVQTNNDRMKGYETASTETNEEDLRTFFAGFAQNSQQCRQELANEIITLGGTPTDSTKISGKIFRAWMDIKATLTGRDLRPILDSCDSVEETAIGTYRKVLKNRTDMLSTKQHLMIVTHNALLKADHTRLAFMRNAMVLTE